MTKESIEIQCDFLTAVANLLSKNSFARPFTNTDDDTINWFCGRISELSGHYQDEQRKRAFLRSTEPLTAYLKEISELKCFKLTIENSMERQASALERIAKSLEAKTG